MIETVFNCDKIICGPSVPNENGNWGSTVVGQLAQLELPVTVVIVARTEHPVVWTHFALAQEVLTLPRVLVTGMQVWMQSDTVFMLHFPEVLDFAVDLLSVSVGPLLGPSLGDGE
ncbi:MAG: hypothetical protein M4579_007536 [Chaenotheca gracillima]|nr:MAG: hypothetical protein M4579_007536 [Chaenotheca gracillima]